MVDELAVLVVVDVLPRYQTLPSVSWANQSKVSSTSPVERDGVPHDAGGDALDVPALVGHRNLDDLGLAIAVGLLVGPRGARYQRQIWVVDHVHEVRRIELRLVVAAVARIDGRILGRRVGGLAGGGHLLTRRRASVTRRPSVAPAGGQRQRDHGDQAGHPGGLAVVPHCTSSVSGHRLSMAARRLANDR